MTGYETNRARVIGRVTAASRTLWALECVCGNVFRAAASDIRRRPNMSCGCRGIAVPRLKRRQSPGRCRCCPSQAIRWRGLCLRCYSRARHAGALEDVALPSKPNGFVGALNEAHPAFKGTQTDCVRGYNRIHKRLSRALGPASQHRCAEGCGRTAVAHSYDGHCPTERFGNATGDRQPYCEHIHHYQPRCGPCHWTWDRDTAYVAGQVAT